MLKLRTVVAILLGIGMATIAHSATYTVTSDADSGAGTLREAITLAEGNAGADVITFAADMTIALASPLPDITTDITIQGLGWDRTIIDGGNPSGGTSGVQLFVVTATGSLVLDGVGLLHAYAETGGAVVNDGYFLFKSSYAAYNDAMYGGFLANGGEAEVTKSAVIANSAGNAGGGIVNSSVLALRYSILADNVSDLGGGGLFSLGGVVLGFSSVFQENWATNGGAVSANGPASLRFANCTFNLNTAPSGAAVGLGQSTAEALLSNCTVTANTGESLTGGPGAFYIRDSIVAGNYGTNCSAVGSAGGNIEDADTCGGASFLGDLVNTDPLLGPQTELDRGGTDITVYYPPTPASPAVDSSTSCSWDDDANPSTPEVPLTEDQRRLVRPWDGDGNGTAVCDRGAVEYQGILFWDGFETGDIGLWSAAVPP